MIHQAVDLGALRATVVAPVVSPLPTLVALIGQEPARAGVLASLRPRERAALLPLRTGGRSDGSGGRANEVVPVLPGASLSEHLDAVAAVDPDALARNIEAALRAGHAAGPWRPVAADPARWLRTYVTALLLQPLLAPPPAGGWTDDYADVCLAIRYSVPNAWRAFDGEQPSPASLEALVGPQPHPPGGRRGHGGRARRAPTRRPEHGEPPRARARARRARRARARRSPRPCPPHRAR